ncbi:unnamed protein product, partial [Staurois parvus]
YLFLDKAARCLPGFCNGARHDSRVPSAHEQEALALCDWSLTASGICHVSQVPPYHSQKAPLLAHKLGTASLRIQKQEQS